MPAARFTLLLLCFSVLGAFAPQVASADAWRPVTSSCVRFEALGNCVATPNAGGLWNLEVGPGGTTAYGTAWDADTLHVFDRDPATGRLTPRACFRQGGGAGCTPASGLDSPDGLAMSDDGRSLYVGTWSGALAVFRRDPANGNLTFAGCLNTAGNAGCAAGRGLVGARDVQISADQRTVYAGPAGSIATFSRNTGGGATHGNLTQLSGTAGCITEAPTATCADAVGLGTGGRQLALSADGRNLYAGSSSLVILKRNTSGGADHGALSQDPGTSSCFQLAAGQCRGEAKLLGATAAVMSPDDRQLYVSTSNGILAFARSADGGLTLQNCINDLGNNGCAGAGKMLTNLTYLAIAPDGEDLVANTDSARPGLVIVSRDPATGNLSQRSGTNEVCVSATGAALDNGVETTGNAGCVFNSAIAGDGRITFAGANTFHAGVYDGGGAMLTFKRDFPPVCPSQRVDVTRDTSIPVAFGCTDRNGDTLTYTITGNPVAGNLGAVDQAGGRVFYNPFGGFTGADSFKFRATAAPQTSGETTVTLNVVAPPDGGGGPVAAPAGLDGDGDGFFAGQDCNDSSQAIRPGAVEIKGNRIDENCDGFAEPFPTVASGVTHNWSFKRNSPAFTLAVLKVTQQFPKGWKAQLKCAGKGCPLKTKTLKAGKVNRKNESNLLSSLTKKQRKFRAGQIVEVWVSAPNFNTKVARIALKKGKQPVIEALCVAPDQTRPQKSCA